MEEGEDVTAVTWRREGGGTITIDRTTGSPTSLPGDKGEARGKADRYFGVDQTVEEFDGGCRWTRASEH